MEKNGIEEDDIKKEKNSHLPKNYYTNRKKRKAMALPRSQSIQP